MADSSDNPPPLPPPRHVAIIMDGNGRWAKKRGKPRTEGHRQGVRNVERVLKAARDLDIEVMTFFAFSVENWKRPESEVHFLMNLLESFLREQTRKLVEQEIRFRVTGRPAGLPPSVQAAIREAMDATRTFTGRTLVLALNYGSRSEVVDAARALMQSALAGEIRPEQLDWDAFRQHLYLPDLPDPDLVIRTSGETRLSNFLLLQAAYAEWIFSPVPWPEFDGDQFAAAISDYRRRERRFGLTSEQLRMIAAETTVDP
ncbi:MAG: polyprenyl diphosphate synthase [Opitutales bacterium]